MPPGQSRSGQQGSYSWALLKASSFTTPVAFTQGLEPWIRALGSFPRDLLLWADQEGISPPPPQALFTMYTYRGGDSLCYTEWAPWPWITQARPGVHLQRCPLHHTAWLCLFHLVGNTWSWMSRSGAGRTLVSFVFAPWSRKWNIFSGCRMNTHLGIKWTRVQILCSPPCSHATLGKSFSLATVFSCLWNEESCGIYLLRCCRDSVWSHKGGWLVIPWYAGSIPVVPIILLGYLWTCL